MDKAAADRMFEDPEFVRLYDAHLLAAFVAAEAANGRRWWRRWTGRRLKKAQVEAIGQRVLDDLFRDATTRPLVLAAMARAERHG